MVVRVLSTHCFLRLQRNAKKKRYHFINEATQAKGRQRFPQSTWTGWGSKDHLGRPESLLEVGANRGFWKWREPTFSSVNSLVVSMCLTKPTSYSPLSLKASTTLVPELAIKALSLAPPRFFF